MTISPFSILARAAVFFRNKIANYSEQTRLANERHGELTAQQAQSDQLARESANSIATLAQPTDAVAELTAQRETAARATAEALVKRDTGTKAGTEEEAVAQTQSGNLATASNQLSAVEHELSQLAALIQRALSKSQQEVASLQRHIQQLEAQAKETNYNQFTKAEAQIELIKELLLREPDLAAQRDAQGQLATQYVEALDSSQQEIASLQQRIHQLEVQANERAVQQQMQQEEMIKAEAQIELIKALLLREPGL